MKRRLTIVKRITALLTVTVLGAAALAGCGSSSGDSAAADTTQAAEATDEADTTEETTGDVLKVGAAISPHADILELIKPTLEEQGITLEIVTLDAEDLLNQYLAEGEIDANYFQHEPYLDSVIADKGYDLEVAAKIHIEPIGLYSESITSIDELQEGDKIGVPNNPSNEYRALKLLESNGLITLQEGLEDYSATIADIAENPKNLEFVELEAAQLPRSLPDLTAAVINTNIVVEAGLDPSTAIIRETADSPYANIVVVRAGDTEREDIQALVKALQSDEVKQYLEDTYGDAIIPAF
ncbi:MAG: MetQ/NlpA family ABC transporter substrate-binding protein [Lachnospiraceae bacterium]